MGAMPAILPVNFTMYGDDIVFRTAPGTKFTAAVLGCVVAFQIDEFEAETEAGWSVMAVGRAVEITDPTILREIDSLPLQPWAAGAKDHVVLIRVEHLTGRRILDAAPATAPAF